MGFFDKNEEQLRADIQRINSNYRELRQDNEGLTNENAQLKSQLQNYKTRISDREQAVKEEIDTAVNAALEKVGACRNRLSQIALLVRAIGFFLLFVSIAFAYLLTAKEFPAVYLFTSWSVYLFSQFAGLYLCGYGRPLEVKSILWFGIYMTLIFLGMTAVVIFSLLGLNDITINPNILTLACVNSTGILVLMYAERETIRLARQ